MESDLREQSASRRGMPGLRDHIVTTPGVRGGKPRIAGHRITVSDVAIWHERMGMSAGEIVSEYPTITRSDVSAALAYYFDHRNEVDREILESEAFAQRNTGPGPRRSLKTTGLQADAGDDSLSS